MGGVEKSELVVGDESIAERTVDILGRMFAETLVASSRPAPWARFGLRVVPDHAAGEGPLAGLAAGLAAARTPWVLAVAGDMPALDEALLRFLCGQALARSACVVPRLGGRPEPLHAVYRSSSAPLLEAALLRGERKLTAWLAADDVAWVDLERLRGLPGAVASVQSINAPEDLARFTRPVDGRARRGHT